MSSSLRLQRTILQPVTLTGIGLFTGHDITLTLLPAEANHGLAFQRIDLPGTRPIPALVENTIACARRTVLERDSVSVQMTEHVLSALAGFHIDNCLIQLDGPEAPGLDGSSQPILEKLCTAGLAEQPVPREVHRITEPITVTDDNGGVIHAFPSFRDEYTIQYEVDYGPDSPITKQTHHEILTTESYKTQIASARTFVLKSEVDALRAQGIGTRISAQDVLVFDEQGPIENALRFPNECARHKLLDCVGDFALLGCDLIGDFVASKSGHALNRALILKIKKHEQFRLQQESERAA